MGQRLIINCFEKGERIASVYYHWSAYTFSALIELKCFTEKVEKYMKIIPNTRLAIIKAVEEDKPNPMKGFLEKLGYSEESPFMHGGVTYEDLEYVHKLFPTETFKKDASRNDGLVALSEDAMASHDMWGEGFIDWHIDTGAIENGVLYYANAEQEEEYQILREKAINSTQTLSINPFNFKLNQLNDLILDMENKFRQSNLLTWDGQLLDIIQ